jgi:hypothetical protein
MATQPKIPPDETLDILRRLEPALTKIDGRLDKLDTELRRQGEGLAELRGRVNEMSSKMVTIWQIVGAVLGINAGIMGLGFALAKILPK